MKRSNNSLVPLYSRKKPYLINLISCVLLLVLVWITLGADFSKSIYVNILGLNFRQMEGLAFIICYTIILAVSLNLSTGCLGELVLGHAGFMAIGGYAGAIFLKAVSSSITSEAINNLYTVIALLIGFVFAGIAGFLVGIPALRLRGDYLAIITLGFGQIIVKLLELFKFTGGASGLTKIPKNQNIVLYVLIVIIVVLIIFTLMRSRFGRMILAIRDDNIASEACGIPVTKCKIATFALSAALAGIGGVLFAQYNGVLLPSKFSFNYSIDLLVIVVLGGLGSFTGSIVSATILTIIPESLRFFSDYRIIVYSVILIIIMITRPSGLLGRYEFSMTRFIKMLPKRVKNISKKIAMFIKGIFKRKSSNNSKNGGNEYE